MAYRAYDFWEDCDEDRESNNLGVYGGCASHSSYDTLGASMVVWVWLYGLCHLDLERLIVG